MLQKMLPKYCLQQVYQLVFSALSVRYRRTYLGLFWVVLNPIFVLVVQSVIFSHILNIKIIPYFLYLVSGLLPWLFISQTLEMGTSQLKSQSLTIKAFFIEPPLLTIALVLENLVTLFIAALLVLVPLYVYYDKSLLLLPLWLLNILPLSVAVFSITFICSTLNILFSDLRYLIMFLLSILYFITPIFYTKDLVPAHLHWIVDYSPVYTLLAPFQVFALGFGVTTWVLLFLKSVGLSLCLLLLSFFHWRKIKNSFYLNL